jgi:hypothetical protein
MLTPPSLYPDVNLLLADLLARLQSTLGEQLVGLYLHGSLVGGDFDPRVSDIDLLAVLASDLDDATGARLASMHDALAQDYADWRGRIEVAYLSRGALAAFRTNEACGARISPGEPFNLRLLGHYYLVEWYVVRQRGLALWGPAPEEVIPSISRAEFTACVAEHLAGWAEWSREMDLRRAAQAYVVLTMCRGLYALSHGEQASKLRAAAWAAETYPEWAGLIGRARTWRAAGDDSPPETAELSDIARFVEFAIARGTASAPLIP